MYIILCFTGILSYIHFVNSFRHFQLNLGRIPYQDRLKAFEKRSYGGTLKKISESFLKSFVQTSELATLSPLDRIGRALNFYSTAVPVFAAYQALKTSINIKEKVFGEKLSEEDEEVLYQQLHEWGSEEISEKIKLLKGFYVKTGQVISTRVDIFPEQYTSKLAVMQDALDPVEGNVIKEIVSRELLNGAPLSDLFLEFDDEPLGSASIAQVHKAKLLDGRTVAVKVMRPGIEAKLLGDVTNLKQFSKVVSKALPVDYYKIFTEMERTLKDEIDFLREAQSANKIAAAVSHLPNNQPVEPPVIIPLPITGLVSRHVLVMEYVEGTPLSKLSEEMAKKGVTLGSPESKIFGKKLLSALTDAYGYMIFGSGIIHGDPHPGNIFVCPNGEIALLDCGQVKEITKEQKLELAEVVLLVNQWERASRDVDALRASGDDTTALAVEEGILNQLTSTLANRVRSFNVKFKEGANDTCAAAVAILLYGNSNTKLPGGYAGEEISANSPIVQVAEFPQELVLLGRATVMIRGIANRLGINWGLSDRWATIAMSALSAKDPRELLPIWGVAEPTVMSTATARTRGNICVRDGDDGTVRFRDVIASLKALWKTFNEYMKAKVVRVIISTVPEKYLKIAAVRALTIKDKIVDSKWWNWISNHINPRNTAKNAGGMRIGDGIEAVATRGSILTDTMDKEIEMEMPRFPVR